MRALTENDFERDAKGAYDSVFNSSSPFEEPFAEAITARAFLFPVHYVMERALGRGLMTAAKHIRESSFFLSVLERPPMSDQDRPYHWQIGFNELDQYNSLGYPFVLE